MDQGEEEALEHFESQLIELVRVVLGLQDKVLRILKVAYARIGSKSFRVERRVHANKRRSALEMSMVTDENAEEGASIFEPKVIKEIKSSNIDTVDSETIEAQHCLV